MDVKHSCTHATISAHTRTQYRHPQTMTSPFGPFHELRSNYLRRGVEEASATRATSSSCNFTTLLNQFFWIRQIRSKTITLCVCVQQCVFLLSVHVTLLSKATYVVVLTHGFEFLTHPRSCTCSRKGRLGSRQGLGVLLRDPSTWTVGFDLPTLRFPPHPLYSMRTIAKLKC